MFRLTTDPDRQRALSALEHLACDGECMTQWLRDHLEDAERIATWTARHQTRATPLDLADILRNRLPLVALFGVDRAMAMLEGAA